MSCDRAEIFTTIVSLISFVVNYCSQSGILQLNLNKFEYANFCWHMVSLVIPLKASLFSIAGLQSQGDCPYETISGANCGMFQKNNTNTIYLINFTIIRETLFSSCKSSCSSICLLPRHLILQWLLNMVIVTCGLSYMKPWFVNWLGLSENPRLWQLVQIRGRSQSGKLPWIPA